jgi:hypothetical protein
MSKRKIVICLLLGPPGWLCLAYKLLLKRLPAEVPPVWCHPERLQKCKVVMGRIALDATL